MNSRKYVAWMPLFLLSFVMSATTPAGAQLKSPDTGFITAEELKEKLARNEPVTIIDVRATGSFVESENRIKGAIHIKVRRLRYRLGVAPLKNIPRDSEVVTYCACPSDESSVFAAQVLTAAGFKHVRALKGGWEMWLKVDGQVERRP